VVDVVDVPFLPRLRRELSVREHQVAERPL
jgi:hypothetical protein